MKKFFILFCCFLLGFFVAFYKLNSISFIFASVIEEGTQTPEIQFQTETPATETKPEVSPLIVTPTEKPQPDAKLQTEAASESKAQPESKPSIKATPAEKSKPSENESKPAEVTQLAEKLETEAPSIPIKPESSSATAEVQAEAESKPKSFEERQEVRKKFKQLKAVEEAEKPEEPEDQEQSDQPSVEPESPSTETSSTLSPDQLKTKTPPITLATPPEPQPKKTPSVPPISPPEPQPKKTPSVPPLSPPEPQPKKTPSVPPLSPPEPQPSPPPTPFSPPPDSASLSPPAPLNEHEQIAACRELENRTEAKKKGNPIENAVLVRKRVSELECPSFCVEEQFFDLDPSEKDRGKCQKLPSGCDEGGGDGIKFQSIIACEEYYQEKILEGDFQSVKEEADLVKAKAETRYRYTAAKNTCIVEAVTFCLEPAPRRLRSCLDRAVLPCFEWDPFISEIEKSPSFDALGLLGNKVLEWRKEERQ